MRLNPPLTEIRLDEKVHIEIVNLDEKVHIEIVNLDEMRAQIKSIFLLTSGMLNFIIKNVFHFNLIIKFYKNGYEIRFYKI